MSAVDPQVGDGVDDDVDDRDLAAAAAAGDRTAFETLIRRHGPALHRFARRMTRDEAAVQDIVQETFVAAWRQIERFRGDSSPRTWLFAICSRKVADSHRVKRAIPSTTGSWTPPTVGCLGPVRHPVEHGVPRSVGGSAGRIAATAAGCLDAARGRRIDLPADRDDPESEPRRGTGASSPRTNHPATEAATMAIGDYDVLARAS